MRDRNGIRRLLALTVLLVALLAAPASAADVTVTVEHDDGDGDCGSAGCTLREAIAQAGASDRVILPGGTYELVQGQLQLDGDTVSGAGARGTVIDGLGGDRVLHMATGVNAVAGVTIKGGDSFGASPSNGVGGGILVSTGASLTLTESTVRDNSAHQGGGIGNGGTLTVVRSTLTANGAFGATSGAQGGALWSGGTATLRNSTVSGNETRNGESPFTEGGGIYLVGGTFVAQSATIANNQATVGSAIARNPEVPATITISHTIVDGIGDQFTCNLGAFQGDHNVVDSSSCGSPVVDPQLGGLTDNGGQTDTHAIGAGSPAVNAGTTCDPTDQRGVARVGACDVGAYESGVAGSPGGGGSQQPPPPADEQLPPPEAGESVNVLPQGTVKVKLPGSKRFRSLTEGEQLPVGTVVDALKGRVTIVAAGGQSADFYGGIFRIGQGKGAKPLTTLKLVEKLSCPKRGRATAAAKKKKRRLWGDGKGRFRTDGSYSSATVRGTKWLVEDRCTSTLTRVTKGSVSVRDKMRRKTVIVRAGKKYVAKRRP